MIESVLNDIMARLEEAVRVRPFPEDVGKYQPNAFTEVLVHYISSNFGERSADRCTVRAAMTFEITVVGHRLTGEEGIYRTLDIVREKLDRYPYTVASDTYASEYNGVWVYTQKITVNKTMIYDRNSED